MAETPVRVLLVDDDEDEYVIVGDLLRSACTDGFDLKWASTYEQGLEAIVESGFDVCLVDYRLGSRSGLDLLAEITSRSRYVPVILLTGDGDRGVDLIAARGGAADYLIKGELTAASLERSVRYAVEHGRTLKAERETIELENLNLAKNAFLATMSHEMRTPMNAILGLADMLSESPLDSEQAQYVKVIRHAGADLLLLINNVLDLSRMHASLVDLECHPFDLEDVLDQAVELSAVKAHAKGIIALLRLSPDVATSLIGDPARLKQVLINLLGNAVKFTHSGEVILTVRNHKSGKSGHVEFAVSDTGIGIPPDKLERIFEDFMQADTSTTRKFGGTGVGLGISRRLIERMGGRLTAISSEGQGSTFRFAAQFDVAPENAPTSHLPLDDIHDNRNRT